MKITEEYAKIHYAIFLEYLKSTTMGASAILNPQIINGYVTTVSIPDGCLDNYLKMHIEIETTM